MAPIVPSNLIIGLALMFMLALIMTYWTYQDVETFFIFLTIFAGFVVWAGLIDLWVLIICVIVLCLIIVRSTFSGGQRI